MGKDISGKQMFEWIEKYKIREYLEDVIRKVMEMKENGEEIDIGSPSRFGLVFD